MWKPQIVHILVEEGIARHPRHAVHILNLSPLQDPSAEEALAWAQVYRACRNLGLSVSEAARVANAYWTNQVSPMATIRLNVNDPKTIGSLMACYSYPCQLTRKPQRTANGADATPKPLAINKPQSEDREIKGGYHNGQ
jgi:hypothetical protein